MRSLFYRILNWVQWGIGKVPASARRRSVIFPTVYYATLLAIAVLLGWFSTKILEALPGQWEPGTGLWFIDDYWCGILFLLAYLFVRLVIYFVTLLFTPEEVEFADIWEAWLAGIQGLGDQRLDIRWIPVFLINGFTPEEESRFFQSLRMNWRVVAPDAGRNTAPLRFYANEEAVCISCTNIGAVSAQLTNFETRGAARRPILNKIVPEREPSYQGTLSPSHGAARPVRFSGAEGTLSHEPAKAAGGPESISSDESSAGGTLGATLRRTLTRAIGFGGTLSPRGRRDREKPDTSGSIVPLTGKQLEIARRRMQFLCGLLAGERHPWCPVNGMLQAAPLAWSETGPNAPGKVGELSQSVATDVETVCQSLALQFPLTYVLTGFDGLEGFGDFIDRIKRESGLRDSRAGSRYPIGRPIQAETAAWIVTRAVGWLKGWIYKIFADDLDNPSNRKVYYLLCSLRGRQQRLQTQVERSFALRPQAADRAPVRLSGVYFGAVGGGLVRGVFCWGLMQKLIEDQDAVAWSPDRMRRDRLARTSAIVLFVIAAGLVVLDAFLAWNTFKK